VGGGRETKGGGEYDRSTLYAFMKRS
jgi:hypothetical protein